MEVYIGWLRDVATYVGAITSIVSAVWALCRFVHKVREGGEGFVRRRLKLLVSLRVDVDEGSELERYLDESIKLEKLRIASGTRLNPREMATFMRISELGLWGPEKIRAVAKYLKFPASSQTPKILIKGEDVFEARACLALSFLLLLVGTFLWAIFAWKYGPLGIVGGAVLFVMTTFVGGLVAGKHGEVRIAKEVKEYLDKNPNVLT